MLQDYEQAAARDVKLHPKIQLLNRIALEVFGVDLRADHKIHNLRVESRVYHLAHIHLSSPRLLYQLVEHRVDVAISIQQNIQ